MSDVTTQEIDLRVLVQEYEDLYEEEIEYEFSNGKEYYRPAYNSSRGVYAPDE